MAPLPPAPPVIIEGLTVDGVDAPLSAPYSRRWNGGALRKLNETVKDALDPNGILAPGKSGIWPKGQGRRAGERA